MKGFFLDVLGHGCEIHVTHSHHVRHRLRRIVAMPHGVVIHPTHCRRMSAGVGFTCQRSLMIILTFGKQQTIVQMSTVDIGSVMSDSGKSSSF